MTDVIVPQNLGPNQFATAISSTGTLVGSTVDYSQLAFNGILFALTTSESTNTVSYGNKDFTLDDMTGFAVDYTVQIISGDDLTQYMYGVITNLDTDFQVATVAITVINGSIVDCSSWTVQVVAGPSFGVAASATNGVSGDTITIPAVAATQVINTDAAKLFTPGSNIIVSALSDSTQYFRGLSSAYTTTGVLTLFITAVGPNSTGSYAAWGVNAQDGPSESAAFQGISTVSYSIALSVNSAKTGFTWSGASGLQPGSLFYLIDRANSANWMWCQLRGDSVSFWVNGIGGSGTISDWIVLVATGPLNNAPGGTFAASGRGQYITFATDNGIQIVAPGTNQLFANALVLDNNSVSNNSSLTFNLGGATAAIGRIVTFSANATMSGTNTGDQFTSVAGPSVLGKTGTATGTATVITGTANQILQVGSNGTSLAFTTLSIASSSITGIVSVPNGGTGTSAITAFNLVAGSGTAALTMVAPSATAGVPLISNGTASNPSFGQLNLSATSAVTGQLTTAYISGTFATSAITGIFSVPNGGTGTSTLTASGLLVGNGTSSVSIITAGDAGQLLVGQTTTSNPAFKAVVGDLALTAAGTATIANGVVTYAKMQTVAALSVVGNSSSATATAVAISGTANQVLAVNSAGTGLAFGTIVSSSITGILSVPNGGTGTSALTAGQFLLGNGTSAVNVTSLVSVSLGGTGTTTLTANGVLLGNGTSSIGVAVTATSGFVLTSTGTATAPTFQASSGSSGTALVLVPNGGTGTGTLTAGQFLLGNGTSAVNVTSLVSVSLGGTGTTTLTANGVLLGNGTSSVAIATIGTSGQALISNGTTSAPTFQTLASNTWSSIATGNFAPNATASALVSGGSDMLIVINGVSFATAARAMLVKASTDGSSFDSTTSHYGGFNMNSASVTTAPSFMDQTNQNAAEVFSSSIFIRGYNVNSYKQYQAGGGVGTTTTSIFNVTGFYNQTATIQAIQFSINGTGTSDAGVYTIYVR